MNFSEWLIDQYHTQATEYRHRLNYEVNYCKRVYNVIKPEVKVMLNAALKEVPIPELEKWKGDKEGCLQIFEKVPKPNFPEILKEFIND